jgi:hypothetical protein
MILGVINSVASVVVVVVEVDAVVEMAVALGLGLSLLDKHEYCELKDNMQRRRRSSNHVS